MAFALSVTYSVQLLGIYLVFATLIVPALVSFATSSTQWAGITGIIGYAAGLLTALWLDWPAGACIVVLLVLSAAIITLLQRVMLSRPDTTSLKQPS
jgi:zinc/manganese transport system permease protein